MLRADEGAKIHALMGSVNFDITQSVLIPGNQGLEQRVKHRWCGHAEPARRFRMVVTSAAASGAWIVWGE